MQNRLIKYIIYILVFALIVVLVFNITKPSIPNESAQKIAVYTRNKPKAELTVAVIDGSRTEIRTYGKGGREIEVSHDRYEIGDISKTFTGAMLARAILEDQARLSDKITDHMVLSQGTYAPSLFELVTHTSAYGDYPRVSKAKFNSGKNPYAKTSYPDVITIMDDFRLNQTPPYMYSYSDLGATIVGMVLEDTYGTEYYKLLTDYLSELGLENTGPSLNKKEAPNHGWVWSESDEYIASMGLSSNIDDMVKYARMLMNGTDRSLLYASTPLVEINMENRVAFFWEVTQEGIMKHSGETASSSSAILIDKNKNRAVIVLSNYAADKFGSAEDIADAIMNESLIS